MWEETPISTLFDISGDGTEPIPRSGGGPGMSGREAPAVGPSPLVRLLLAVVLVVSVLAAGATGSVVAHDNVPAEPGASGSCGAGDGGGSFAVHVGDHENNLADEEEARNGSEAATYAAENEGDCGEDGYFEVHVISAAKNVQYCYSERSDGDDGDSGNGNETTDNVTASNGLGEVNVNNGSRNYPPPGDPDNSDGGACTYNRHNENYSKNSSESR